LSSSHTAHKKQRWGRAADATEPTGNVAIQWRNTQKTGYKNDAEAVTQFAAQLPVKSKLRHHIVGDMENETIEEMEWKHIKNDINGNGRWVCHWMTFEKKPDYSLTLTERYNKAARLANEIGDAKSSQ